MKKMIMNCFHGIVKLLIYIFLIAHDHAENLTMKKLVEGVLDFDSVGLVLNVLIFLGEKMKQFFYRSKLLPFAFKLWNLFFKKKMSMISKHLLFHFYFSV